MGPLSATLLTLSFAGDHARCRVLCETVDRFVPAAVDHVLAVPAADLRLFGPLAGGRRRLVAQEDLLPGWLVRIPMPPPAWRRALRLPRRDVYLSWRGGLVRGWIAQQVMKLVAAAWLEADIAVHCDSDSAFVRPLDPADLLHEGRVRLLRVPGHADTPTHRPWHETASALLGLPPCAYHGADYIENVVVWQPALVRRLLDHVAGVSGRDPVESLARTRHLSEYILYGVYCDRVLGMAAARHAGTPDSLCASIYVSPKAGLPGGTAVPVAPHHRAIGIQSTIPLSPEDYRAIVEATIRSAADQDAVRAAAA